MEKTELYRLMENPKITDGVSLEKLNETLLQFPYFQTVRLLRLKKMYADNHPDSNENLTDTAIFCADRKKLYYWVKDNQFASFLPKNDADKPDSDRTTALLDSFLNNLVEEPETEKALPHSGLNIISYDYLSYLESVENKNITVRSQSDENLLEHHDLIDRFIEKSSSSSLFSSFDENKVYSVREETQSTDNVNNKDEFLTETLARIYIKQKKYEQALTIIKRLSLNFPKKSVYFADQIRFLELLIINEKNKKQS